MTNFADPSTLPGDASDSESLFTMYNGEGHVPGSNRILAWLRSLGTKIGSGSVTTAATAVGKVLLPKLDGTTDWGALHLFSTIKNPSFERWSRGTSVAVAASIASTAGYGPDGWCLKTNANQASHWTQVTGLTDSSQFAAKVGRDSGQTGTGVMVAERAYRLAAIFAHRNQKISLGLTVKAGANWSPTSGNLTIRLACGTGAAARRGGSAYTSETTLISQTIAITTTATLYQYVSSVVVPTNATQMSLSFEWTPVGTAGADDTFTVDDVMVNVGDVPMPFKVRPDDDVQCLRELKVIGGESTQQFLFNGWALLTTNGIFVWRFDPPMEIAPTVSVSAAGHFNHLGSGGSNNTPSGVAGQNASTTDVEIITTATGLSAGASYTLQGTSTSARLTASSEL